jgi:hypothetical protein
MPRHINAEPSASADRRDFGANGKHPEGNLSASELIADAAAARTDPDGQPAEAPAADEHHQAGRRRHRSGKRHDAEALPTMEELEDARGDHSRKITEQEADRKAQEANGKQ